MTNCHTQRPSFQSEAQTGGLSSGAHHGKKYESRLIANTKLFLGGADLIMTGRTCQTVDQLAIIRNN